MDEMLRLMNEVGLTFARATKVSNGDISEAEAVLMTEIERASAQWRGKPIGEWPPFTVRWDVSEDHFHFSADGLTAANFKKVYPQTVIRYALMDEVVTALHPSSVRTEPSWSDTYAGKTAILVERWRRELSITPPMICGLMGKVRFEGGNHRFNVAKEKGEPQIPLLFAASFEAELKDLVPSLSVTPVS